MADSSAVKLRSQWASWAKGGTWLSTLIMSFVVPPPEDVSSPQAVSATLYARFLLAVITGLFSIVTQIWKRPKNSPAWLRASVVGAALSVLLIFNYQAIVRTRTAAYDGRQVIVGYRLTPYGEQDGNRLPEEQIMDAGGKTALVWTADSIHYNATIVFGAYLAVMVSTALCVLLALEAARRAKPR